MADLKTRFTVELQKQGDGAKTAATELRQVEAGARGADAASKQLTETTRRQTAVLQQQTAIIRAHVAANHQVAAAHAVAARNIGVATAQQARFATGMQNAAMASRNAAQMIAFTAFPQIAAQGFIVVTSIKAITDASRAMQVSFSTLALTLAGVAASFGAVAMAIGHYRDQSREIEGSHALFEDQQNFANRLTDLIEKRQKEGTLSNSEAFDLQAMLVEKFHSTTDHDERASVLTSIRGRLGLDVRTQDQRRAQEQFDELVKNLERDAALSSVTGLQREKFAVGLERDKAMEGLDQFRTHGVDVSGAEKQINRRFDSKLSDVDQRIVQQRQQEAEKEAAAAEAQRQKQLAEEAAVNSEIKNMRESLTLQTLSGIEREMAAADFYYNDQRQQIEKLSEEKKISADVELELLGMVEAARKKAIKQIEEEQTKQTQMQQILGQSEKLFASGLSNAILDFTDGTKKADEAFKQFARNFLRAVADMILQTLILNAISGILGGASGAAKGGQFPRKAAAGVAGVSEVGSPTYFPKFNVLAGEAGREVMTVLAKPRLMEVGGIAAQVGNAGPHRLAIVNAHDLAAMAPRRLAEGGFSGSDIGFGAGGISGRAMIEVRPAPGYEARITEDAIQGARVTVVQDMSTDSPLSQATKQLVS